MDKKWDKTFLEDLQYSELSHKNTSNQSNKQYRNDYYREYFKDPDKKQRHKRSVYKSHAKHFVKRFATEEDMNELCRIFNER
nr:MAG TPA: hypothetical protein [Caudoviricetes sp.]